MKTAIIIPARMKSTRLPNKPLADINGKPMIQHVWERAMESHVGPVAVACSEPEVAEVVNSFGGVAIMTDPDLPSGSDRVHAALLAMELSFDAVVCLQGDLPTIDPDLIRKSVEPLHNHEVDIATLATLITDPAEVEDPNVVKIAFPVNDNVTVARALYFSRNKIPANANDYYHHIGLYAYKTEALAKFIELPQGILEQQEKLEQLRALENGMRIDVQIVDTFPLGVDTEADLQKARDFLKKVG